MNNPSPIMPMLRRVYPTLMDANLSGRCRIYEKDAELFKACTFLSRGRIKNALRKWDGSRSFALVNIIEYENGEPTWMTRKIFRLPAKREAFIAELACLADLHGIIKISRNEVYVRQIGKVEDLNIDVRLIDAFDRALGGKPR